MEKNYKILNRDQIKYLAIVLMTFNHIAHILMTPGTVVYEVFEDMGYFTSIIMCYFLVEGYFYTHSKRDYAKRLFLFALISEIPYLLAMGYFQLNVIFTFLICFCILLLLDSRLNKIQKILSVLGLILLSGTFIGFVEYSVFLVIRIHRLELIKRFVEVSNQKFGT